MPTPLDVRLRGDMRCYSPRPGKSVCQYGPGPKHAQIEGVILPLAREAWRQGLSDAPVDRNVMLRWAAGVRAQGGAGLEDWLQAMRAVIWADVAYNNDPPGFDSVKTPEALVHDGEGDCVSLTVALTALAHFMLPGYAAVSWRIGGGQDPFEPGGLDPDKHIWPVVSRIPVEMTVNIPIGEELNYEAIREVQP